MPWREQSVVDQREEFVRLAVRPEANMSELCRRFGISRTKGIKWKKRFLAEGVEGLGDRSRRLIAVQPGRTLQSKPRC